MKKDNVSYTLRCFFLMIISIFILGNTNAQKADSTSVYKLNYWIDIPVSVSLSYTNYLGLEAVYQKTRLDSTSITLLNSKDINRFDRAATKQNPNYMDKANTISDYGFALSFVFPFFLFTDKDIRQDWGNISLLYLETIVISTNIYSWGAANNFDRNRPLMYNPDVDFSMKQEEKMNISFYSGHVSTVATASFFTAKVLVDYHPEWEQRKKIIAYSVAVIPPAFVGYFRFKAMKHFPTDIITGFVIGSSIGILVPHLHLRKDKLPSNIQISSTYNGICLSMKF
jgi:PAP2 superfamily